MAVQDVLIRRVFVSSLVVLLAACSGGDKHGANPTAPSAVSPDGAQALSSDGAVSSGATVNPGGLHVRLPQERSEPSDVTFPPRNEPLLFRTALEAQYRDVLRRAPVSSFVDQEGTVVWTQEYLRYRVNLCPHPEAVFRVFRQIDGFGVQPVCGSPNTVTFPPRNEPFDFMIQLEAKYRDGLRRPTILSFVDIEGNIVWTQEYLRYRVTGCGHSDAQQRVFDQIGGRGVQPTCSGGGGGGGGGSTFTGSIPGLGDLSFLINMTATGTYQAMLTWPDSTIDLDLYLATTGCTTYPPTNCLVAVSKSEDRNFERVQYPVRNGEQYRLWVDNFTNRPTTFSVEHFIRANDTRTAAPLVDQGASVIRGSSGIGKTKQH